MLNLYSVFDQKAKAYLAPFAMTNDDVAMRAFADTVNDGESPMAKHPEDYTLIRLGTFDDDTGEITKPELAEVLGKGVMFVQSPQPTE